mgnify:CR=1 FL=1|tara:strand:- start:20485 stop:21156 length:672 start_codon:yes stop_codon:yes gene_type:complete
MPDPLIFDVNETLLDMAAMDPLFERFSSRPGLRGEWFSILKESWLVDTVNGDYQPFGVLAKAALVALGRVHGFPVSDADQGALIQALTHLPAHPEVPAALARLRNAGFSLVAFSNGTDEALATQLDHAGLRNYFDRVLTVQTKRNYKPAVAAYRWVAGQLAVEPEAMTMIAAHGWDLTGAARAGCRTAFVARPGKVLNPSGATPDMIGADLNAVADQLLAASG